MYIQTMSERETYEAQGRAHANLKQAKSRLATINTELRGYIRNLEEANGSITQFLAHPERNSHLLDSLKQAIRRVSDSERICSLVDEFVGEMKRVAELQEQIDQF
jgi:multidrug resistance efflux pump